MIGGALVSAMILGTCIDLEQICYMNSEVRRLTQVLSYTAFALISRALRDEGERCLLDSVDSHPIMSTKHSGHNFDKTSPVRWNAPTSASACLHYPQVSAYYWKGGKAS